MKRIFLVLALALATPTVVYAQQSSDRPAVDTSRLSPEQVQALNTVASQMAEEKSDAKQVIEAVQNIDKDEIREWSEVGTEAGKAVGNFAREVGVVAAEFLNTFVGKATFLLIFMNFGGGNLAQFFFDVVMFSLITPVFAYFMFRLFKRYVLQVQVLTTRELNQNTFLRVLGFNKVNKEEVAANFESYGEGASAIVALVSMVVIFILTWFYLATMWPNWPHS